jgi:hypothetical protein
MPPTTIFVTGRQEEVGNDDFSFRTAESMGKGQELTDSIWKGLQATELDVVHEGEGDTLQTMGVKPPSTNKSATFRKGRIIRMGSATL